MNVKLLERRLLEMRSRVGREVTAIIDGMPEELHAPGDLAISTHPADQASEALDRELGLIANEQALKDAIEAALARIRDGTFGHCLRCRQPIPEERLKAIPYAVYCKSCAEFAQASHA